MSLNPRFSSAYTEVLGRAQFIRRDYDGAIESFQGCVDKDPQRLTCRVYLAAIHGLTGYDAEAAWEAEEILSLKSDFVLADNIIIKQFQRREDRELLRAALRHAGLPES